MRVKVRLDTMKDINQFVSICSEVSVPVYITDGVGLRVSAKSVLGVMYSMEFAEIWCESEADLYTQLERFTVIE